MRRPPPDGALDAALQHKLGLVAGVDEVGRGALAGPVTVAAVILDPARPIPGLDDSKRLTPARRAALAPLIRERAVAWAIAHRSAVEIDRVNILEATRAAMKEAILRLSPLPGCVVSDAVALAGLLVPVFAEAHADGRYLCVAAASIIAKVERDGLMEKLARAHPEYGWERNKGYGTPAHLEALHRFGPSEQHRRSFAPARVLA